MTYHIGESERRHKFALTFTPSDDYETDFNE